MSSDLVEYVWCVRGSDGRLTLAIGDPTAALSAENARLREVLQRGREAVDASEAVGRLELLRPSGRLGRGDLTAERAKVREWLDDVRAALKEGGE